MATSRLRAKELEQIRKEQELAKLKPGLEPKGPCAGCPKKEKDDQD